jgi:thiol-disulfide isomerase/thioredoxin
LNAYWANFVRSLGAALVVAALAIAPVTAAPPTVEPFDAATWDKLQQRSPRPSAIVFTATYCASCPAVLTQLSDALKSQGAKGDVVAVVIDEADTQELLKSHHYLSATHLYVFSGNEAALRYRVDPRWRGVTPFVALLGSDGQTRFATGAPSAAQLKTWLAPRSTRQP